MATLSHETLFASWNLSEQELMQGSILSTPQEQVIQNQIAQLAQEKLLLKFTPDSLYAYAQREAELQGQINALQFLITTSAEFKKRYDPSIQQLSLPDTSSF